VLQVLKYAKGGNFEKCCEFRKDRLIRNLTHRLELDRSGPPLDPGRHRRDPHRYAA
jgi:hypothetical protein